MKLSVSILFIASIVVGTGTIPLRGQAARLPEAPRAHTAHDTLLKPVRLQDLSLRNLPLKDGERIAAVQIEIAGARFRNVHVPDDWGFEIGPPVSDVSVLKGTAQHGVAMLFTTEEFQHFVTLAFYDYGEFNRPFSIKASVVLCAYDRVKGDSERLVELPAECVSLEEPSREKNETGKRR